MTTANIYEGPHFAKYSVLPVSIEVNQDASSRFTCQIMPDLSNSHQPIHLETTVTK